MAHLEIHARPAERVGARIAIDMEPRQGSAGSVGDLFSVDIASIDLLPDPATPLRIYVGKLSPSFGWEYRHRYAPSRPTVTPSLIARYTHGTPLGIKVRGSALRQHLWFAAALTDGTHATERFGHVTEGVSGTARLAARGQGGAASAELGVSGQLTARDGATGWQAGADLTVEVSAASFWVEGLLIEQPGTRDDRVSGRGGLAAASWQVLTWLAPVARIDARHADLWTSGNLYLSHVMRLTGALRLDLSYNLVLKGELSHPIELAHRDQTDRGDFQIPNDVLTLTALVRF